MARVMGDKATPYNQCQWVLGDDVESFTAQGPTSDNHRIGGEKTKFLGEMSKREDLPPSGAPSKQVSAFWEFDIINAC